MFSKIFTGSLSDKGLISKFSFSVAKLFTKRGLNICPCLVEHKRGKQDHPQASLSPQKDLRPRVSGRQKPLMSSVEYEARYFNFKDFVSQKCRPKYSKVNKLPGFLDAQNANLFVMYVKARFQITIFYLFDNFKWFNV
jgi:hypothetical protein